MFSKTLNIDFEEYSEKLSQVTNGILSEEEWKNYCQGLFHQALDDAKVFNTMKENEDSAE